MNQRWQDWVGLVLGVWLFLSPWLLAYAATGAAAWSAWAIGVATIIFFAIGLAQPRPWEEWVNIVLAALLILAPFFFGFMNAGIAWNHWIVGLLIGADAIWALAERPSGTRGHA